MNGEHGDRFADYTIRVMADPNEDQDVHPLQRAFHSELCRGPHASNGLSACYRAWKCYRKWDDGRVALQMELDNTL